MLPLNTIPFHFSEILNIRFFESIISDPEICSTLLLRDLFYFHATHINFDSVSFDSERIYFLNEKAFIIQGASEVLGHM